jgi:hypothetical protein
MFKLFNKNKVGEIILKNGNYTLYKTSIENLKILNCINWNKNRPYDKVRVDDIKKHYINENLKVIPGIIHAWKNKINICEIFDGIHRYLAGCEVGNMELLIQIYETDEVNIIKEFKNINKSVSVPCIYLEENNYIKRTVCENVVKNMCEKYKNCISPSRNCQKQNFNRDNLIEFISKLEIDFEIKNVDNIIIQELTGLNYQAKDYVTKNKIPVPQKSHYNNLYLFYLQDGFIKDKLETTVMRDY